MKKTNEPAGQGTELLLMNDNERHCWICKEKSTDRICPRCGMDADKLEAILSGGDEFQMPSFWKMLFWRRALLEDPTGEAVWELLSEDFRQETLERYRSARAVSRRFVTTVMVPLMLGISAVSFLVGLTVSRCLQWPKGLNGQWLFAYAVTLMGLIGLGFPIGGHVERRLGQTDRGSADSRLIAETGFIGLAVMKRCPLPWYWNPDVLFPAILLITAIAGRLLLAWTG